MRPNKYTLEKLRKDFNRGSRVELIFMDDPRAPQVGTRGTVIGVDDAGTIHVDWDDGCKLGVAWGVDDCRLI